MDWKEEYSLGIEEIDRQHQQMLRIMADIEAKVAAGGEWNELHLGIVELRSFAQTHFYFEEALMRSFGFGETREHEEQHKFFFTKLHQIERQSLTSAAEQELLAFLRQWQIQHMAAEDRRYADYLLAGAAPGSLLAAANGAPIKSGDNR